MTSHLHPIYTDSTSPHLRPKHPMAWVKYGYEDVISPRHTFEDVLHLRNLLLKLHPKWIDDVEPFRHVLGKLVLHPHGEHAHGPCWCHFPHPAHLPQIRHNHENCELESSTCKLEHVSKRQCKLDRIFNTISFSLVTMQIPSKRFVGWHVPCSYNFTKPNIDSSHIKCTLIGIWCNLLAFRRVHPKSSDLAFLPCWSSWWCLVKWVVLSTIGWYTTIICWNPNLLTLQSSWFD